jgi:hypothetical protein
MFQTGYLLRLVSLLAFCTLMLYSSPAATPTSRAAGKRAANAGYPFDPPDAAKYRDHVLKKIADIYAPAQSGDSSIERTGIEQMANDLASLHTDRASPILIRYLTMRSPTGRGAPVLTNYPCAWQLAQLGSKAWPTIHRKLNGPCTDKELRLLAQVTVWMDGRELGEARLGILQRPPPEQSVPREPLPRTKSFFENVATMRQLIADPEFMQTEIE